MGNCCTEGNVINDPGNNNKSAYKFGASDKAREEKPKDFEYSDVFSEFSDKVNARELEEHAPCSPDAVKIREIPEDLKVMIDDRMMDVSTFEFDQDNDIVGKAILLGPRQLPSHAIYIGQWYDKMRNGRGQQVSADGTIYEGYWKNGKKDGKGRLIDKSGDVYRGAWKDDMCHGYGELTKSNGAVYRGFFKHDKRCGKGVEMWPTGERYEGNYEDGQKHGIGTYWAADGSYYKGEFKFNSIDGRGKFFWSDESFYNGEWKNNEKNGQGKYKWPDGSSYEGGYSADEKDGHGTYTTADGDVIIGRWNMGSLEGEVMVKLDGKKYEGRAHGRGFSLKNESIPNAAKMEAAIVNLIEGIGYEN